MEENGRALALIVAGTLAATLAGVAGTSVAMRALRGPRAAVAAEDARPADGPGQAEGRRADGEPAAPETGRQPSPRKAKAGDTLELGGTAWELHVDVTYDAEELGLAARQLAPTLARLPEGHRTVHVRGFREDAERWAYAVSAGDGDAVRAVISAPRAVVAAPGVTEANASSWQAIVDASTKGKGAGR